MRRLIIACVAVAGVLALFSVLLTSKEPARFRAATLAPACASYESLPSGVTAGLDTRKTHDDICVVTIAPKVPTEVVATLNASDGSTVTNALDSSIGETGDLKLVYPSDLRLELVLWPNGRNGRHALAVKNPGSFVTRVLATGSTPE